MQKSGQVNKTSLIGHHRDWTGVNPSHKSPVSVVTSKRTFNVTTYNNRTNQAGVYVSGGPFYCDKHTMDVVPSDSGKIFRSGYPTPAYEGSVVTDGSEEYFGSVFGNIPDYFSAEAYKRAKNSLVGPNFSFLNAAFELKDVPRMLRQRFTPTLKAAGSYWLALKFGWEPLLKDIRDFVALQRGAQKRIAQLLRDEGKTVRRRGYIRNQEDIYSVTNYYGTDKQQPVFVTQCYGPNGQQQVLRKQIDKVWYSGRFRYHLPGGPRDVYWKKRMLARIYGMNPTPSVVYNAIPWSWLVDWFTNLGDVINNLDSGVADRISADYFYVMRHFEISKTNLAAQRYCSGYPDLGSTNDVVHSASLVTSSFRKARIKGNPFGFSWNQNDLSPTQWSILGALGLSRL